MQDFDYNDEPVEEEMTPQEETPKTSGPIQEEPKEEPAQKPQVKEEHPSDDFEEAARIAKAKQKEKGLDLQRKAGIYVQVRGIGGCQRISCAEKCRAEPVTSRKKNDRDEEKRRPTFDLV